MDTHKTDGGTGATRVAVPVSERPVYVIPQELIAAPVDVETDLVELWNLVWRRRWHIIAITAFFAAGAVAYSLLATEWYRVEVLLAPAESRSIPSLGGQLGSLAALAGVTVGDENSAEAIAILRSNEFARSFIEDFALMPVLYADKWDSAAKNWLEDDPSKSPDIRDGVKYFREDLLRVSEDKRTGLVSLSLEWKDPELAAAWAAALVDRLNARVRERALREAEANVAYLQSELAKTNLVTLQQSIGRLLENELQKLMLARGNEEFAFVVLDPAAVPNERVRPRRAVISIVGTVVGGVLGILWVLMLNRAQRRVVQRRAMSDKQVETGE
jgi:uncharacterized protein involved in exopolysaccharide biosynthesis